MAEEIERRRWPSRTAGVLAALLLIGVFVWFVRSMMAAQSGPPSRKVQVVELIRPPPAPPPPPPDQPPPPPKSEEPLPDDQPEPAPQDEPAPAQPLGLDAAGTAGSDAFGLQARAGGSDLVGGTGSAIFAWYTNRLKDAVNEKLSGDTRLGSKRYTLSVRVWLEPDGRIKQVKLVTSTGNRELDQRIEADLAAMPGLGDGPPLELPQPISLRIASHS
jgi:protein TonB